MIKNTYAKIITSFAILAVIVLLLSPFIFKTWLTKKLRDPLLIGNYQLHVEGFSFQSLFSVKAKNLTISGPTITLTIDQPSAVINPIALGFGGKPFVTAKTGAGQLHIHSTDTTEALTPFPEFSLPVHITLRTPFFQIVNGNDTVSIVNVTAENLNSKSLIAQVDSLNVHRIFHSEKIAAQMSWNDEYAVHYVADFEIDSTYVHAKATSPKENALYYTIESNGYVHSIEDLYSILPVLNHDLPDEVSLLKQVTYKGVFSIDADAVEYTGSFETSFKSKPWWPLPRLKWAGSVELDNDTITFSTQAKGDKSEAISLTGSLKDTRLELKGTTQKTKLFIGGLTQTMDTRAIKFSGDIAKQSYKFSLLTQANSLISGRMVVDSDNDPDITFKATVAPLEPWALLWTEDNISIRQSHIAGRYLNGSATITVLASSPNTYNNRIDSVSCSFTIDSDGIEFYDSWFVTRDVHYFFDGDISWEDTREYVRFNVQVAGGGSAKFFSDFDGNFSINASEVSLTSIPLRDSTLLTPYGGTITGNWSNNTHEKSGNAVLLYQTLINNTPLYASSKVTLLNDTLNIDQFTVTHSTNSMSARGKLLNPMGSFTDLSLLGGQLEINDFNLSTFSKAFLDSIVTTGTLNSALTYSKNEGIEGFVTMHNISLKGYDPNILSISRVNIDGLKDKVQLSARLNLGEADQWDSEIAIDINDIFKNKKSVSTAIVPYAGGLFVANATIDKRKNIQGDFVMDGPWELPFGIGSLLNSNFKGAFTIPFKNNRFVPSFTSIENSGVFTRPQTGDLPFTFDFSMNDTLVTIPNFSIRNQFQESVSLSLSANTANKQFLESLLFSSSNFTIPLGKGNLLKFIKLKGTLLPTPEALRFSVKSNEVEYVFKDPTYGTTRGVLNKALLSYIIPSHSGLSEVARNHSIVGSLNIQSLIYEKKNFPEIGLLEWSSIQRFANAVAQQKPEANRGAPINLDITIQDDNADSLWVLTNYPSFPFTLKLSLKGNTHNPLLSGDITSTDDGTLKLIDAQYNITRFEAKWDNAEPKNGVLSFDFNKYFDQCMINQNEKNELTDEDRCNIAMSLNGQISNLELSHSTSAECSETNGSQQQDFSASNILTTMIADCASSFESFDQTQARDLAINKLGKEAVKWVQNKVGITSATVDLNYREEDVTSKLTWQPTNNKNLSLFMGYTYYNETGKESSKETGVNYQLPMFDNSPEKKKSTPSRGRLYLDAAVNWGGQSTDLQGGETEKNEESLADTYKPSLGVSYNYRFWTLCLWGIGLCEE